MNLKRFETNVNDRLLVYGTGPCRNKNHHGPNGLTVRTENSGCWACQCGLPPGAFTHDFGVLPEKDRKRKKKYNTPEEARAAHNARQILWNKKNYDHVLEYSKEYQKRPEVKERIKQRRIEKGITEEQRQRRNERQRLHYQRKKAAQMAAAQAEFQKDAE